jgi:hypothetical protein
VAEIQAKVVLARLLTSLGVVAVGWSALHVMIMGTGMVRASPLGESVFLAAPLVPLAALVVSALSPRQRISLAVSGLCLSAFIAFWAWILWLAKAV